MAYEWQSDIIRPDGENGTEVLDTNGVYQPQIEGGDNITIEDGKISASGTLENVQADYTETDTSAPSYIKHKPDLSIYATASGMETELAGKQDVIEDLSTIRSGAEAGSTAVQPGDLATVATTGSYTSLTNTPQNIVQDASYVHTDNNFSNADKSKLDGIAAGAEVNVQADWSEADPSSDAYIANKPTIPAAQQNADWNASSGVTAILNKPDLSAYATDSELTDGLATKQDIISDLDSIRAGAAAGATAAQPSDLPSSDELLPSVSSGDAGKILSVDASGNPEWITPSGGTTYSAGDGIDIDANNVISADVDGTTIGIDASTKKIKSLQTIPTKTSDLQNDSNFVVASSLATVATTGSYADLSNKPSIPAAQVQSNWNETDTSSKAYIENKPSLATVATTGAYSDLSGKPSIPTKTSDLQNDSNFVSSSSLATVATTGSYSDLSNKPTIPAAQIQSDWTEADTSSKAYIANKPDLSVYATTSAMETALSGKQDTISDLDTIRSGAALGATAAQPSDLPSSDELLPSATSGDAGKILSVDASGNPEWITPSGGTTYSAGDGVDIDANNVISADVDGVTIGIDSSTKKIKSLQTIPTVDQTYNASSSNAQSGVAVASAISGVNAVPASTSADSGKVLKVDSQGAPVWGEDSGGTVFEPDKGLQLVNGKLSVKTGTYSGITNNMDGDGIVAIVRANNTLSIDNSGVYVTNPLPASEQADAGKILTVNSSGNAEWATQSTVTVDQTYNASSSNAQSGTAVAGAIAGVNQVPASTSADENKVLTVNSSGNPVWEDSAVPESKPIVAGSNITITENTNDVTISATDTTYTAGDGIDITGGAISADVDGVTIGIDSTTKKIKSLQTIPSVDQTYNASSSNAQSGTAVAQAIAAIPSSSYTAGDGIAIESGEISVDYDSNTLDTVVGISTESVTAVNHTSDGDFLVLPTDIGNMATGSDSVQITLHIPGNTFYFATSADPLSYYPAHVGFAELRTSQTTGNLFMDQFDQYLAVSLTGTFDSAAQKCWLNEQDVSITLPVSVANNWVYDPYSGRALNGLVLSLYNQNSPSSFQYLFKCDSDTLTNPVTFTYSGGSHEVLTVKNPLPASAQADSGKVLKVNASGNAEWGTDSDTTYTAGNMIAINANNSNAIGVSTTAGITDIQQVAALPANPVATVLYLIPET